MGLVFKVNIVPTFYAKLWYGTVSVKGNAMM